jgi:hypothetical protein
MNHHGFRQPLVCLIIAVHLVTICGCTVTNRVTIPGNEIPVRSNFKIATVILKDGEIIEFDTNGGLYVEKTRDGKSYRVIAGTTEGKNVEIDPEKVLEVKLEHRESNGTGSFFLGLVLGLPVGAGIVVLIAAMSFNNE